MKLSRLSKVLTLSAALPALAIGLMAASATSAQAQSLPFFTWNGFYAGGHAGATHNDARIPDVGFSHSSQGLLGGAHVGYLEEFGQLVLGGEADFTVYNNNRARTFLSENGASASLTTRIPWMVTARMRAGIAIEQALFYVTGGAAISAPTARATLLDEGFLLTGSAPNKTRVGWTAGGGVEYGFAENYSVRAEFIYYDLGKNNQIEYTGYDVRLGLSYRF